MPSVPRSTGALYALAESSFHPKYTQSMFLSDLILVTRRGSQGGQALQLCGSCGRPAPASPLPYPSAECPEFGRCWPELAAAQEQYQAAPLQPRLVL
eukprot:gene25227-biopygen9007